MLCLHANTLFGAAGHINGTVKDNSGSPVEFATVALLTPNDSILITGTVTDAEGHFSLDRPERHAIMRISALGFTDKYFSSPTDSIGDIILAINAVKLGEVTVNHSPAMTRLKNDGIQVAVAGTYLSHEGTAGDLLSKMPFVIKSGSELEVLGKGTPVIYINGRQLRDKSELDQLASSQIKSVDIVTNPGARYASTVNSVIRITTITPAGEDFSFSDRTTIGYKHYAYLFEQANFNYRKNGFDVFGMVNYENYRERPRFVNSTTQFFKSATITQNSEGKEYVKYPVYQGKVGLNYVRGTHNSGFYYDFSYRPSVSAGISSASRWQNYVFSENLDNTSDVNRYNRQHLLSAYYSGNIGNWQLSANFDAIWQINDRRSAETETSSINSPRNFITNNNINNRLLAGNAIASFRVWKGELRFGTEVSDILRNDSYKGNTDYIVDSDSRIAETTTALFAETQQNFSAVSLSAGVRWEYTDSKYCQSGILQKDQSRTYHNIAPSASLSFPMGRVKANISYTRKITRPAFEQLSSAIKYIDRYSYQSGNPNLRPIYRDYLSASARWKEVILEFEYCSTSNYFMWQTQQYAGNDEVTLLKMENMPRFDSYGAYINYNPTFFRCWHPSFMAGIEAQDFKLTHQNHVLSLDKPLGIFRFNNAIQLPWNIWLNVDFSARTSGNGDNLYIKSSWTCNVGLYKSFANDNWSVKLQLNDVFDTSRQKFTSYDAISRIAIAKINDTRDLSLTLRYNFNSARSRYKGRGASNPDKNRL